MSEPVSISSGIAERYATAIFELARSENELPSVAGDVDTLRAALAESDDLNRLIRSPVHSRAEQEGAMKALGEKMGLTRTITNSLRLMATKRRLFVLPQVLTRLREMIARENGEISADVTSARPLSDEQRRKLSETLAGAMGRDVNLNLAVDESLIGGLIVKVGSTMIDTSIRSKLNQLQNNMKEVG